MKIKTRVLLSAMILILPLQALACGDSMYRVGKGVSYRVYTAPLPGSVLVYGESEGARQLAEALAQSGHGVRLVSSGSDLTSELSSGDYDVVIAPYSEHNTVSASASAAGNAEAIFLPVVSDRAEAKSIKGDYSNVMVADRDEIKHYLKAIHKTLKAKGQG